MSKELSIEEVKNLFPGLPPRQRAFLITYALSGQVLNSCKAAGIHWTTHYHWKKHKKYRAAVEQAQQITADFMEDEVHRRAFDGIDHPVTFEGKITDTYKVYSDNLAMFRLKKLRPEYRDNFQINQFNGPAQLNVNLSANRVNPMQQQTALPTNQSEEKWPINDGDRD
jgi:hypothetical protein